MKIVITPENTINLESNAVSLANLRPVVNGTVLEARSEISSPDSRRVELRVTAPENFPGTFGVSITQTDDAHIELRYWLRDVPSGFILDSFGIHFAHVENLRTYLRNGYTSWDGSFYVEPDAMRDFESYEARPETGFAMTQLLPRAGAGCVVAGFDHHEHFQHTFTFDTQRHPTSLTIQTLWDQKVVETLHATSLQSERLVIFEHAEIENALREWARIIADAAPIPPRHAEPITGWCSWYNLYGYINEENILAHLRGTEKIARQENLPLRIFQIDDGFTPEMGDWLDVKPQFPRGMKSVLDHIHAAGFVPGLWIAPFMVGNRSRLYRDHPDWVVRELATDAPLVQWKFYGEFRWHKRSEEYYILDTTHPDAFEYLHRVFHVWHREWGCEYFKTDFMFWGAEHGPARVRWHNPGLTRIEIWRRVAEMIRAEIGEASWLGCGCPLWAAVGLVDGIRIGSDVGVEWHGHLSAQSLLRDQATRNFTNHILWQTDPDCILLRDRFHHLTEPEERSLALYAAMNGGVRTTSDALDELAPEHLRWSKLIFNSLPGTCNFPFLGQSAITYERLPADLQSHRVRHQAIADPVLVQVRGNAVFIFNTGDAPVERTYTLAQLGNDSARYVYDWVHQTSRALDTPTVSVILSAHEGTLLFFGTAAFTLIPERLP